MMRYSRFLAVVLTVMFACCTSMAAEGGDRVKAKKKGKFAHLAKQYNRQVTKLEKEIITLSARKERIQNEQVKAAYAGLIEAKGKELAAQQDGAAASTIGDEARVTAAKEATSVAAKDSRRAHEGLRATESASRYSAEDKRFARKMENATDAAKEKGGVYDAARKTSAELWNKVAQLCSTGAEMSAVEEARSAAYASEQAIRVASLDLNAAIQIGAMEKELKKYGEDGPREEFEAVKQLQSQVLEAEKAKIDFEQKLKDLRTSQYKARDTFYKASKSAAAALNKKRREEKAGEAARRKEEARAAKAANKAKKKAKKNAE